MTVRKVVDRRVYYPSRRKEHSFNARHFVRVIPLAADTECKIVLKNEAGHEYCRYALVPARKILGAALSVMKE